jgi:hypothetical protein
LPSITLYRKTPPLLSRGTSYGDDFHFSVDHLNEIHLFDKVHDLIQTGIDVPTVISHGAYTDLGSLPEVIISNFGDGHIEPMPHAVKQFSDHMALSF